MRLSTITLALVLALSVTIIVLMLALWAAPASAQFGQGHHFQHGKHSTQKLSRSKKPKNGFSSGNTRKQKGFGGSNSGRNFKRSKHKGFSR